MSKQTCPECGARLRDGADRCDLCGLPVGAAGGEGGAAGPEAGAARETGAPRETGAAGGSVTGAARATGAAAGPETGRTAGSETGVSAGPETGAAGETGAKPEPVRGPTRVAGEAGAAAGPDAGAAPEADEPHDVFCNQCGSENVAGSRFCSQCGARLQAARPPSARPAVKRVEALDAEEEYDQAMPTIGVGRHLGIVIGSSLLLVIALFLINVVSSQTDRVPTGAATAPPQAAPPAIGNVLNEHASLPLTAEQEEAVRALEAEIAELDGDSARAKQRELVEMLAGFGRIDRAAIVQQEIAEDEDTADAWRTAGDLLFDWMEAVGGEHQGEVATLAVAAYQRVLEKEPDDLDVRADMAWAYQYDPRNSMEAITQNNFVLERDPDHVQANFNRGIFLMRINRLEQALQQFEHLQGIVGEEDPVYRQAEAMKEVLRDAMRQQPEG